MDQLTHGLTGLMLSRTGLNRWCPRATAILVLAAVAPDIDLLSRIGGDTAYLHYHRHLTHAILAAPALAGLMALAARLFGRVPWRRAFAIALAGVLFHLLLDWTNSYGVRGLLPFSGRWFRLDITYVADAWIGAVLLLAAGAPLLSRLVSSEIGARPATGRGWALFALGFVLVFNFGRFLLHDRAIAVQEARLYRSVAPLRVEAFPNPWNPFHWHGVVETDGFYALNDVNLLGEFRPSEGRIVYKPAPGAPEAAAARAARATEDFRVFLEFAQVPLWRFLPIEGDGGGMRVEVTDLRFGSPETPRFVAVALVDGNLRVRRSGFAFSAAPF